MIKGVNRQVVEITQPDCEYFERILFLVKPEYTSVSEGKLRERASMMSSADKPPATRVRQRTLQRTVSMLLSAVGGAGLCALVQFLMQRV